MIERSALHAELIELRARVEELEAELAYFRDTPSRVDRAMNAGLSRCLARVAVRLAERGMASHEVVYELLTNGDGRDRSESVPKVQIMYLRQALREHGIKIETVWGWGYRLAPEHQQRLRSMIRLNPKEDEPWRPAHTGSRLMTAST